MARVKLTEFRQGGLIDDRDVEIVDAAFVRWDYDGQADQEVTALKLDLMTLDDEEVVSQYWSVGGDDDFMPTEGGRHLEAVADRQNLGARSNFQLLVASLQECGMEDEIEGDDGVFALIGTRGHVIRWPAPKMDLPSRGRSARRRGGDEDAEPEERKYLKFDRIDVWGWEAEKSSGKGKAKGKAGAKSGAGAKRKGAAGSKGKAKPKAAKKMTDEQLDDLATEKILEVLQAADEPMEAQLVSVEVYNKIKDLDKPNRDAVLSRCNDEFIGELEDVEGEDDGWVYAGEEEEEE